jgi:hypothetical protein
MPLQQRNARGLLCAFSVECDLGWYFDEFGEVLPGRRVRVTA